MQQQIPVIYFLGTSPCHSQPIIPTFIVGWHLDAAYGGRCAIAHRPEPRLLDAAHILTDADEQLGQPIVSNGLPLTKIHHAARPPATSLRRIKNAYQK
jgi:hypothetical protein